MNPAELAPSAIRAISPYQPGKPIAELAREMGLNEADIVKLASNENPLGMSPLAREAAMAAISEVPRYPDGNGFELKSALSQRLGVALNQIVLGNGSNDILEMVARAFLSPGLEAIYAQYGFAVYPLATQAAGAHGVAVAAKDFGHDLPAMLAAINSKTRVVFIANPNNPTGTLLTAAQLEQFLAQVPEQVLVVLDEAYNEYLAPEQQSDSVAWLARFPNLVLSRTFSKAYGLAGLRVGYALAAPQVADLLNRVRQPFNVSNVALAAASAALADQAFVAASYQLNRQQMAVITDGLNQLGLAFIPSAANFVTFKVGDGALVNAALLQRGVIVRPIGGYGLPQWLRVSIGLPEENQRFLTALAAVLANG
jgi:histidinol-phosphate aminotransferase